MVDESTVGTPHEKVEEAERLLREACDDIGYPDNSYLTPAIDQIEAHRRVIENGVL